MRAFVEQYYALAPLDLPSYRTLRYDGGDMSVDLAAFPHADQRLLGRLYQVLTDIFELLRVHRHNPVVALPHLRTLYHQGGWAALVYDVRALGETLPVETTSQRVYQVIHDLRGGAFQALAMHLQLLTLEMEELANLHRMFFLARDQLKIMRNALPAIDPVGLARDQNGAVHAVELLVEKWQESSQYYGGHEAVITVEAHYTGAIAERCLEFSALDRVIYNLINNAVRHSATQAITLTILPLGAEPADLRFVVTNPLTVAQQRILENRFPEGVGGLFHGGFTTDGSGLGLRICADFVCNAYGLNDVAQGLAEGHFGIVLAHNHFVAWFHWPVAAD
ncbi:ATP-binding protein [Candidatus Chloroploca asiatica]|uniref:Histidine kinase/HSP90-like ATPase domain-containing protein n=1 Tax=Candidatus Chloroploca asiatica TaxID=1506545 RepID=A0A2H3KNJ4_9CHLR|nr:ATP-binding protein [Candidatus Chloroploca asiatica]PDV99727.1 hypothetical protein A9Q02_00460 [Candidatus Chloroploca asiatica]